jgi:predicted metal-dependent peptidase
VSTAGGERVRAQLAAARARLILDKPFIGVLLLHLPFEPAAWCRTVATDARRLYYDPQYIEGLDARQTQFVLAHQALHCALGHFARRGHRIRNRWDAACDFAVNLLLIEEGLPPVADALVDPRFRALGAEEIYPLLDARAPGRNFDVHAFDSAAAGSGGAMRQSPNAGETPDTAHWEGSDDALGSDATAQLRRHRGAEGQTPAPAAEGQTPAPAAETREDLARRWQIRLAMAAQQARHAGRLSASWQRLLAVALEPPLPWRALLARFLAARAQDDYTFQRPPRRESDILLPRLRSESVEVHAVLDTSGSIEESELAAFVAEIDALKGQLRARVTVHACDRTLAPDGPWVFEPWQPLDLPERLPGAGGTDFRPVFEWLHAHPARPDALVYFTDACGEFPEAAPPYPVLWLVKGNAEVPWGERIAFNH